MRTKIVWGSIGFAAAGILAWAFLRSEGKVESRQGRRAVAAEASDAATPTVRDIVRALPAVEKGIDRDEVLALIREAALAYRAREAEKFNRAYLKLIAFGAPIQRLLAEFLLEASDVEERLIAGLVLKEVATAEIGPFAAALVRASVPDDVKGVGLDLLTKFRIVEAAGSVEALLFREETCADLRRRSIEYFIATGGAEVLARAAVEPTFADLRFLAAKGLPKIGTLEAARLLIGAWRKNFVAKKALENYYLLEALAEFKPAILRGVVREFLQTEKDPSARNVFLSMLSRADRALALEIVKEILTNEKSAALRRQALTILASIGGPEAQQILLDILVAAKHPKEVIDCANALLRQDRLDVAFDKVRDLFGLSQDPIVRALVAGILAKYEKEIGLDPALLAMLSREAECGMASSDSAVRGLSTQLAAVLARYGTDPTTNLVNLYERIPAKERDAFPQVLSELTQKSDDPRVRLILEKTLADDDTASPSRLLAADALFTSGGEERVYGAIASSKSADLTALMTGIALARGGEGAASRLERVAHTTEDPAKKQAITDQLKAWSAVSK